MKIYEKRNVFEAALDRIRYLFDEFPNVIVEISGGKDSTVVFHLAMIVAKEKHRTPLPVFWIDQEAEWQGTVDCCEKIMTRNDVAPYWFQMPMDITNNASSFDRYSHCWDPAAKDDWVHPKHKLSIKENNYREKRFHKLFTKIMNREWKGEKACFLTGVRAEETPKRLMSLTNQLTYKGITWGKVSNKRHEHYAFHPVYDWSYRDIWKAIHDNDWDYNRIYDLMYKYGVKVRGMRISNIHHETSKQALRMVHEFEPETWKRVQKRLPGANTIHEMKDDSYTCPTSLPFMFETWKDYTEHLLDNLVQENKNRKLIRKEMGKMELVYTDDNIKKAMYRYIITTILACDWDLTKLTNFKLGQEVYTYRRWKQGRWDGIDTKYVIKSNYIPDYGKKQIERYLYG